MQRLPNLDLIYTKTIETNTFLTFFCYRYVKDNFTNNHFIGFYKMQYITSFFLIGTTTLFFSNPGMGKICADWSACQGIIELCKARCEHFPSLNSRRVCEKKKQCNKSNYEYKSCMELVGCAEEEPSDSFLPGGGY